MRLNKKGAGRSRAPVFGRQTARRSVRIHHNAPAALSGLPDFDNAVGRLLDVLVYRDTAD